MAGINLNNKLWRIPQQGMVRGVCAGIANYFDVPVKLVRILVVLSVIIAVYSVTRPGALEGVKYFLIPNQQS